VPSDETRLGLVVVNYGSSGLLRAKLAITTRNLDAVVVVVDSFSTDGERRAVAALAVERGWSLVATHENVGFGRGMNLGVEQALRLGADVFVLLNPDLSIDGIDVARLVARVRMDPLALVAPRILAPDGRPYAATTTDLLLDDGTMRTSARRPNPPDGRPFREWRSGACLACSAELWRRTGGFADEYFLYWEDVDLSWRVQLAGGTLRVDAEVTAIHDEGGTQRRPNRRAKSETYYYFNIRNRLLYAACWLSPVERRQWWHTTPKAVRSVILQGGRRQLVTSIGPWRAAWRGVRDGRRFLRTSSVAAP